MSDVPRGIQIYADIEGQESSLAQSGSPSETGSANEGTGNKSFARVSDEALMLGYQTGNAAAFEVLYGRYEGPMYRFLLRQTGDAAAAEEVFQDVWMRVVNSRARYEIRSRFSTWVYAIAHNRLVDFYRASAHASFLDQEESEAVLEELPVEEIDAGLRLDRKRATERLFVALAGLPSAQREAFLLQYESGLSVEEIASTTGVTRETAKSRLRYAVCKLRASLKRES